MAALVALPLALHAEPLSPIYRIDSVTYNVDGRTRPWALQDVLEIEEGMLFPSETEMKAFLLRQQQVLLNQRVLQDSTVEYRVIGSDNPETDKEIGESEIVNVAVTISVRDTWNFIVLPYFKYDSNTGLLLSLRTRDYNFFGTIQRLAIDFDFERTEDDENLFTVASEFRLPFNMLDRRWESIFQQSLQIDEDTIDFDISTGLGYYFKWLGVDWGAKYTESYRYLTDDETGDNYYLTSEIELGSSIATGLDLFWYGPLEYRPNTYMEWNYRPGGISKERGGVSIGFEHFFGAGNYNWIGNYRHGQTVEVGNNNTYNIVRETWDRDITLQTAVYRPFYQRSPAEWAKAGASAGLSGFYLLDGAPSDQDDAGKAARGVLDDSMNGDFGLFFNLDAVVTIWTLRPVFEAQFGAFIDIAYVRDLRGDFYEESTFRINRDLRYGAGIEVVGFPLFARSLYLRGSVGTDLLAVREGTPPLSSEIREIFIGLGHHY